MGVADVLACNSGCGFRKSAVWLSGSTLLKRNSYSVGTIITLVEKVKRKARISPPKDASLLTLCVGS